MITVADITQKIKSFTPTTEVIEELKNQLLKTEAFSPKDFSELLSLCVRSDTPYDRSDCLSFLIEHYAATQKPQPFLWNFLLDIFNNNPSSPTATALNAVRIIAPYLKEDINQSQPLFGNIQLNTWCLFYGKGLWAYPLLIEQGLDISTATGQDSFVYLAHNQPTINIFKASVNKLVALRGLSSVPANFWFLTVLQALEKETFELATLQYAKEINLAAWGEKIITQDTLGKSILHYLCEKESEHLKTWRLLLLHEFKEVISHYGPLDIDEKTPAFIATSNKKTLHWLTTFKNQDLGHFQKIGHQTSFDVIFADTEQFAAWLLLLEKESLHQLVWASGFNTEQVPWLHTKAQTDKYFLVPEKMPILFHNFRSWATQLGTHDKKYFYQQLKTHFEEASPAREIPVVAVEPEATLYTGEAFKKFGTYVAQVDNHEATKGAFKKLKATPQNKKAFSKANFLVEKIDQIYQQFPHFEEITQHIENHLILQAKGNGVFYIPPLLMAGGPGLGKTFYSSCLAELAQTYFYTFSMESIMSEAVFSGLEAHWSTAAPGKIFNILTHEKNINPILLVDEIDKAKASHNGHPANALLPLLERHTSSKFKDLCVPLEIDASHIIWFATANDLNLVSDPVKSRFDVFSVPNPNMTQKKALIKGIYGSILKNNSWGTAFEGELSEESLSVFANIMGLGAARNLRRVITTACATAIRNNKTRIEPTHIERVDISLALPWDIVLTPQKPNLSLVAGMTGSANIGQGEGNKHTSEDTFNLRNEER